MRLLSEISSLFITTLNLTLPLEGKNSADRKVRALEFMVGEKVLLKVSPMKGMIRFCKKGKFSPMYIGPFEIL